MSGLNRFDMVLFLNSSIGGFRGRLRLDFSETRRRSRLVFRVLEREVMAMYNGRLPKYAQPANRNRMVKVFCKGICCRMRWAEMNTDCPSAEVLRTLQMGDLTATCLKCGHIAWDPYNWVLPRSRPTTGSNRCTSAEVNQ